MIKTITLGLLLIALLLGGGSLLAQGHNFSINRWVVGSSAVSSGGGLSLSSTIGQAEAGPTLRGGSFELRSGFWQAAGPRERVIFMPLIGR